VSHCHQLQSGILRTVVAKEEISSDPDQTLTLERPQEIDYLLLLPYVQLIEVFDDLICLAATASMGSYSFYEVGGPTVMEEEDTLSNAPEWRCPELVGASASLRDAVGEAI